MDSTKGKESKGANHDETRNNFEPAYKLMADYKAHEDACERLNMSYDAEYWHIKLSGLQNTLKALTGEWPGALHNDDATYKHTANRVYPQG